MINFRLCLAVILVLPLVEGAVRPPPWADPTLNPCADKPRGWQYIYWPADGQCYKIFQIGYPCPETMELVPAISKRRPRSVKAECRCPPSSVFHETDGRCYEIYKTGPCRAGQYISPTNDNSTNHEYKIRVGVCKNVEPCPDKDQISWPVNGKCYRKHTQGPCTKGQLLDLNADMLPVCTCSNENELSQYYWEHNKACYEHYTKGPCQEKGHLFLPDRVCDCHAGLPHYHSETNQCYELGSTGPCKKGHQFKIDDKSNSSYASCKCKDSYIYWPSDGNCYRPYTQGPCPMTKILVNSTSCMIIPCGKGTLYFPEQKTCYRVGSQGPCAVGQIVIFDFRARPSIDGISYNGLCGCAGQLNGDNSCLKEKRSAQSCQPGMVVFMNNCYKLYTQGPCTEGKWLVPNRQGRVQLWQNGGNTAKCDCKPGYTKMVSNNTNTVRCLPPTVSLANYLNKYFVKQR